MALGGRRRPRSLSPNPACGTQSVSRAGRQAGREGGGRTHTHKQTNTRVCIPPILHTCKLGRDHSDQSSHLSQRDKVTSKSFILHANLTALRPSMPREAYNRKADGIFQSFFFVWDSTAMKNGRVHEQLGE